MATHLIFDLLIRSKAGPEKIPCVTIAYTSWAPASISLSAAFVRVPKNVKIKIPVFMAFEEAA